MPNQSFPVQVDLQTKLNPRLADILDIPRDRPSEFRFERLQPIAALVDIHGTFRANPSEILMKNDESSQRRTELELPSNARLIRLPRLDFRHKGQKRSRCSIHLKPPHPQVLQQRQVPSSPLRPQVTRRANSQVASN